VSSVPDRVTVLVYSNSADVRAQVRTAVGRRPAPDTGRIDWIECGHTADVMRELDEGGVDVAILDGEAQPTGGMGLARQYKYELDDCPPIVVLIARPQDGWLASWSLADAVINTPIDPVESASVVAEQLRRRHTGIPVVR
jgi:DNA-binding response OmpR family regulator